MLTFDPDPANSPPSGATPAPTPAPAPVPQPAPAKPAAAPSLDPNMEVDAMGPDGQVKRMTLGELANIAFDPRLNLPKESLDKFNLFEKSASGDAEATRALLDQYMPKPAVPAPAAGQPADVAALAAEIKALKEAIGRTEPVTEQIKQLHELNLIGGFVEQHAATLPYVSHLDRESKKAGRGPEASEFIRNAYRQQAQALGIRDDDQVRSKQLFMQVVAGAENFYKSKAEIYRSFNPNPAPVQNGRPAAPVVDDQKRTPGMLPSQFQTVNGQLVDSRGRPVTQDRSGRFVVDQTIPTDQVTGVPAGAVPNTTPQRGPITPDQMRENTRRRLEEMRAAQNAGAL